MADEQSNVPSEGNRATEWREGEGASGDKTRQRIPEGYFHPGHVIAGQFEVVRPIGRGGMGVVYEVLDRWTNRHLALKTILPGYVRNPKVVERFKRELATVSRLQHLNIAAVYESGQDGDTFYFTMELLRGRTLRKVMKERGPMDVGEAIRILEPVCEALEFAHEHVVHRDLSPENVMVLDDGSVRLLDFGLACVRDREGLAMTRTALGKAMYMAPEQRRDAAHVDKKADLYSLGVMFFEMLTGKLPGPIDTACSVRPDLPKECDELLAKCLVDESARMDSAREFIQGMERCRDGMQRLAAEGKLSPTPEDEWDGAASGGQGSRRRGDSRYWRASLSAVRRWWRWVVFIVLAIALATLSPGAKMIYASLLNAWRISDAVRLQHQTAPKGNIVKIVSLAERVQVEVVWVPPGEFMMGSPSGEEDAFDSEKPQHKVTISKGFWMGKYEVTQAQWQAVMGSNPSKFKGDSNPEEQVSWNDCQDFLKKAGGGLRLPTEAEWEYACRAGSTTKYSFGDDEGRLGDYGWYGDNSGGKTHPVGQKKANAWGLYDMHGNVWEWCGDWYDSDYYEKSPSVDPKGPAPGSVRVFRGGGWGIFPRSCRSGNRGRFGPGSRFYDLGFRVVLPASR